ncbi:MAG TPA: T9SS type A sorting domain-containing protein, partial [Fermentimonas sp.]|nr:T9SS type A sorting domain-containing protein [Fermentimonas sp.]
DEDTPNQMILSQNYPNPFNPATTIKFQLQEPGQVSLKVYNMLGREIAVLVNGMKTAGAHEIVFDANSIGSELSSGVYMYQLQTERSVINKKMTLIK